ncbi:MAG: formylglycine-generating enzyme family protein [Bacteroidia bacterium]
MKYIPLYIFLLMLCSIGQVRANNIQVSNTNIASSNPAQGFSMVEFDLSWDNSWRISVGPSNWDAAWVFVKYQVNTGPWQHAALNYVDGDNDGHIVPAGFVVKGDSQQTNFLNTANGVFVYRAADGSGNIDLKNVQLRWNYAANGISSSDIISVKVFAIEMVYVNQGAFEVGSTGNSPALEPQKFYTFPDLDRAYTISSEAAIPLGNTNGSLAMENNFVFGITIPQAYPKGYNAFYCMKYETSQEQWVSFFNLLTAQQKPARDITSNTKKGADTVRNRNGVSWIGQGNDASTSLPQVAMSFVITFDIDAYLDWACLRSMSEFEFSKACRGPLPAVANQYAWGSASLYDSRYTMVNQGTESETISSTGVHIGNANYASTTDSLDEGPMRCGIFAASASHPNREETGASYYGIMELSGNVFEAVVTVFTLDGRNYDGSHGNGILGSNGAHDQPGWPDSNGNGYMPKGGSYDSDTRWLRVASRGYGGFQGLWEAGFRGVRTAP